MKKATVIIVDDEAINVEVVAGLLGDEYNIKVAFDGEQAIRVIEKVRPDLILLDIHMPKLDGYGVARILREDPDLREIPFIFLTAKQDSDSIVEGFRLGATDYITKPFKKEELLVRVANHIKVKQLQNKLNESNRMMQHYLEIIDRYVITLETDVRGNIVKASNAYCKLSGYTKDEIAAKEASIFSAKEKPKDFYPEFIETLSMGGVWNGELGCSTRDNRPFWLNMTILPKYGCEKRLEGFTAIATDITDKKYIEILAEQDPLTKLYNRGKLDCFLEEKIAAAQDGGKQFCVMIVDVDHFKSVNDEYGHQVGDSVLKQFARILQSKIDLRDILGRWGGEEFVIILSDLGAEQARGVAERIRHNIEGFDFDTVGTKTASFGVTDYRSGDTLSTLIKRADDALYRAKNEGRNRVVFL